MAGYITVLLQKSNPAGDWGFKMGPTDPAASVVITQIDKDCVAAELLEPGDRIIEIEGMETSKLSVEELQSILGNPSKKLSMVVLKKTLPKGNCSVKKTTVQEVQTVEETKEEIERKKEYEVLLEVSPKDSIDDVINDIKGKIERGEKIDAKEMQIISSCNKNVEQSTSTFDSTKHTIQRDFGTNQKVQFLGPGRHSEILKRKEKFLSQQKKEETVECEKVKLEQQSMEEKKKKSNSFWTDPPSDLKHAIENNQYWKRNENGEHITTSAIFSHLNDLHNVQRKGSAREEKRQFWENCRKKYGVDPPASKYHLSHRPLIQMDNNRSKSCEPEHLDRSNPFRREDYRQTNPFYSPTPTNPFYEDYHKNKKSEEKTSGALSKTTKVASSAEDLSKESCKSHEGVITEALKSEKAKKAEAISESYREDFNSKCEFFERATSVPTASCVKNAQDIVSERMAPQVSPLKKPSDFINQVNAEKRTNLTRSQSKEEKATGEQQTQSIPQIQRQRSVSVTEPLANVEEISALQRKVFLGQSVQKQYASSSTSHSSNQCESQETKSAQGHEAHCQMTNVTQHTSGNVSCEQKAFLGQGVQNQYASNLTSQANNQNQSQEVHNLVTTQTDSSENAAYEKKSFLGQSVQKQFVTGITNSSNEIQSSEEQSKEHVIDIKKENNYEKNKPCKESEIFIEAEKQTFQEKKELLERAMGIRKTSGSETTLMDKISDIEQAARKIEADMKESIERIKAESQKLYSLNTMEDQEQITSAAICDKQLNALNTQSHQTILIPDSTAFPGLASTVSGEFHKKSFVESSYEKVTRTGTPYENVESGYKREFRVATPSGFYDNNSEEVFRQEGRMEGFREMKLEQFSGAEEVLDQKFREITRREGVEPTYEYNCGYKKEGTKIGEFQESSNSAIQAATK